LGRGRACRSFGIIFDTEQAVAGVDHELRRDRGAVGAGQRGYGHAFAGLKVSGLRVKYAR